MHFRQLLSHIFFKYTFLAFYWQNSLEKRQETGWERERGRENQQSAPGQDSNPGAAVRTKPLYMGRLLYPQSKTVPPPTYFFGALIPQVKSEVYS